MTTTVVNVRKMGWGRGCDVYIARPSKWGNPFKIGPGCTREEAIARYRQYLQSRPDLLAALPELKGKTLGCYCSPLSCHGDVLVELVESGRDEGGGDMKREQMIDRLAHAESVMRQYGRDVSGINEVIAALESEEVVAEGFADPDTLADYNAGRQHMLVIFKVQGLHTERPVRILAVKGV